MKNQLRIVALAGLITLISTSCSRNSASINGENARSATAHDDSQGYFTCPMHPQVHEHKPGPCPICGMALVKVMKKPGQQAAAASILATDTQMALAGIRKHNVERKALTISTAVSGRFLSAREVAFQVYESDLSLLKTGMQFTGTPSSRPDQTLSGSIQSIDRILDPASRTARVVGVLKQPFSEAVWGGSFEGMIQTTLENQLVIPEDAVLHTGTKDLVYLVGSDQKLRPAAVKLGRKAGNEYQVFSGVFPGDTISRGSNFLIDSEAKIRGEL